MITLNSAMLSGPGPSRFRLRVLFDAPRPSMTYSTPFDEPPPTLKLSNVSPCAPGVRNANDRIFRPALVCPSGSARIVSESHLLRDLRRILPQLRRDRFDFDLLSDRADLHRQVRANRGAAVQNDVGFDGPFKPRLSAETR